MNLCQCNCHRWKKKTGLCFCGSTFQSIFVEGTDKSGFMNRLLAFVLTQILSTCNSVLCQVYVISQRDSYKSPPAGSSISHLHLLKSILYIKTGYSADQTVLFPCLHLFHRPSSLSRYFLALCHNLKGAS